METIFWILVGAFIGWHVPQPMWAVYLKEKALALLSGVVKK